jgi:hypothetical protein
MQAACPECGVTRITPDVLGGFPGTYKWYSSIEAAGSGSNAKGCPSLAQALYAGALALAHVGDKVRSALHQADCQLCLGP